MVKLVTTREQDSEWLQQQISLSESQSFDALIQPQQQLALSQLKKYSWPTRKTEAWKYTSLNALKDWQSEVLVDEIPGAKVAAIAELETIDIYLGQRNIANLPAGLTITTLADATEEQRNWIEQHFATIKPGHHLFGLINDVMVSELLLIDVAAQHHIDKTVRLIQQPQAHAAIHHRVLVRVGHKASLSLIEMSGQSMSQKSLATLVTEICLADKAELDHYRLLMPGQQAMQIDGCHINLHSYADYHCSLVAYGSELARLDMDVNHIGEFAKAEISAVYLLDHKEHFDLHSTLEHTVANGSSDEKVRGIVGEDATAVFNGRIHIHRNAQQTLAELNNRNLLLSPSAEVYTKPELEIYADDVRCAHGATVADIDERSLYYLLSRGIPKSQALVMLNFGFINELIDLMPSQPVADWLRPILRERFSQMNPVGH